MQDRFYNFQAVATVGARSSRRVFERMKTTGYFDAIRRRSDRITIEERWIENVVGCPEREQKQLDGRIRRWGRIAEAKNRWLRVVVLADGVTVHNAFFDRRFRP